MISTIRVGRGGKQFSHYRFRTMEVQSARTHSGGDTALRKTRFGRLIGNLSLDDLPTLVNVLRGDRSIVGPRPEVPDKVDLKSEEWRKVLEVRPGLVGLGALTYLGAYNSTSVGERIKPELYYVEHQSLLLDLQINGQSNLLSGTHGALEGAVLSHEN
jgi:lipopolysaccharide/colanic/teichoic acid biosynthesis glycosyltransferase